ncbi:MAG: tetratricopeptide repeat protein [Pseudonocardiales bacterium]|nr:tetratricopeptide repeat protein [Pseudonocardiales bacterium]
MLTKILPETQRTLGSDHSHTLWARHYLAACLAYAGHFQRSVELVTDLITAYERILGADHPRTLQARSILAWTIGQSGDPARAAEMFRLLLRDRDRVLGANHRHTLGTRYDLAYSLAEVGDNGSADELFTGLITDLQRVIGVDCSIAAVADELVSFGVWRLSSHSVATQRELSALLRICRHALGTEHPLTKEIQRIITDSPPSV